MAFVHRPRGPVTRLARVLVIALAIALPLTAGALGAFASPRAMIGFEAHQQAAGAPPPEPSAVIASADTAAIDRLLGLVFRRIAISHEVARAKWNSKAPIEDLVREQQVIDDVSRRAREYGMAPNVAAAFFRAQIEASKLVQRQDHAQWTAQNRPPFDPAPDLGAIRPELDRLTPEMLRALADVQPLLVQPAGQAKLKAKIVELSAARSRADAAAIRAAIEPLGN